MSIHPKTSSAAPDISKVTPLSPKGPGRVNNFDLIRLLAALHVVVAHTLHHTGIDQTFSPTGTAFFRAFLMIPAVPIFFVVSGFLIMASYERKPDDLKGYFWRRGVRIFPALWVSFVIALGVLFWAGYLNRDFVMSPTFPAWLIAQLTFGQAWNPEHFRTFGTGVVNGALWTIAIELQFYLFVPIYYRICQWFLRFKKSQSAFKVLLFSASVASHLYVRHCVNVASDFALISPLVKLLQMTLLPHLWIFLMGVSLCRHFGKVRGMLENRFALWASAWIGVTFLGEYILGDQTLGGSFLYVIAQSLLAFVTISFAYTLPRVSGAFLRGQDISYGTYLFHYLIINVMMALGYLTTIASVPVVIFLAISFGYLSWRIIEKPALSLNGKKGGRRFAGSGSRAERTEEELASPLILRR